MCITESIRLPATLSPRAMKFPARSSNSAKIVSGFHVGQKVTVQPQVTCGECYPCRHGKYNLCENLKVMGFQTTGMASHYFAAPAKLVLPLPDSMSFDQGAMIEPLAVAVHAIRQFGDIRGKMLR